MSGTIALAHTLTYLGATTGPLILFKCVFVFVREGREGGVSEEERLVSTARGQECRSST